MNNGQPDDRGRSGPEPDERTVITVKNDAVKWKKPLQIILIAAAVAMIVAGVLNGSMRDVWGKAIEICLECIGIG